jgi:superfamily II DNA or RNA helicase
LLSFVFVLRKEYDIGWHIGIYQVHPTKFASIGQRFLFLHLFYIGIMSKPTLGELNNTSFNSRVNEVFDKYRIKDVDEKGQRISLKDYCSKKSIQNEINSYQRLEVEYIKDPAVRGVLVMHGLGSGKTLTAIASAEELGVETIIMCPASLRLNFVGELIKFYGEKYGMPKDYEKMSREEKKKIDKKVITNIEEKYKFISYNSPTFLKQVMEYKQRRDIVHAGIIRAGHNNFDGKFLVIDEIQTFLQNTISGGSKQAIEVFEGALMGARNLKIMGLSATPVIGDPFEFVPLFNLLKGFIYDSKGKQYTLFPTSREDFYEYFVDKEHNSIKNKEIFQDRITGLVSYYKGIKDPEADVLPKHTGPIIVKCLMGSRQWEEYLRVRSEEWNFERKAKYSKEKFVKREYKKEKREAYGTYKMKSRQVSNIALPAYIEDQVKLFANTIISRGEDARKEVEAYKLRLIEEQLDLADLKKNLQSYSGKMYHIVNHIKATKTGCIFVYSRFILSGAHMFSKVLEANGYVNWSKNPNNTGDNYKRFAIIDGRIDEYEKARIQDAFNTAENKDGKIIRILVGTFVIAAGVNLFNVRETHIMESEWRKSIILQVIGRAIRMCGHRLLDKKDRTVTTYIYLSVAPNAKAMAALDTDGGNTVDQFLYEKAENEYKLLESFTEAAREISFDCMLNRAHNDIFCRMCEPTNEKLYPENIKEHLILGSKCITKITKKLKKSKRGPDYREDSEGNLYKWNKAIGAFEPITQ